MQIESESSFIMNNCLAPMLLKLIGAVSSGNSVNYNVYVNNETKEPIEVYFFLSPAKFDGTLGAYTNSLDSQVVQPGGSQATFSITYDFYAAAQRFDSAPSEVQTTSVALVPIGIRAGSALGQRTTLSFDKNIEAVLSPPLTPSGGVSVPGSFQIQTPPYPGGQGVYGIGLGSIVKGRYDLATYKLATPGVTVSVQPIVKFFIAIGSTERGADVNFYSVSTTAALCDATEGTTNFMVVRTNNGQWMVNGDIQQ